MEWTSVDTKMPVCNEQHNRVFSSGKVLVWTCEGCDVDEYLKYYEDGPRGFVLVKEEWMRNTEVTHWMELPNRPNN